MTGFEPWTSGIGSDHSTNWATTTPQNNVHFDAVKVVEYFEIIVNLISEFVLLKLEMIDAFKALLNVRLNS